MSGRQKKGQIIQAGGTFERIGYGSHGTGYEVLQYWGAPAILARLGRRARGLLPQWIAKYHLPIYLRMKPGSRHTYTYYTSESLILHWELQNAKLFRDRQEGLPDRRQLIRDVSQP